MRCVRFGVYFVVAMAMAIPTCLADDAAIARKVAEKLRYQQEQQALKGFHITVKVEEGTVWMLGDVANTDQRDMALDAARRVDGVKLVVNDLDVATGKAAAPKAPAAPKAAKSFVGDESAVRQAAAVAQVSPPQRAMVPYPQVAAAPVGAGVGRPVAQMPQRGSLRVAQCYGGGGAGAGCYGGGVESAVDYGGYADGGVVYEGGGMAGGGMASGEVQMPNHAWPSYASYPNYGAVTYPQQYSPKAWPYIGPFYPYPQVPLGWRKVALEWDDGWWMLDFASK